MSAFKLTYSPSHSDEMMHIPGFEEGLDLDAIPAQLLAAFRACQRFTHFARQQAALEAMKQIQLRRDSAAMDTVRVDQSDEECERWDGLS